MKIATTCNWHNTKRVLSFATVASHIFFSIGGCSNPAEEPKKASSAYSTDVTYKVLAENLNVPWELLWGEDDALWMTNHFPNNIIRLNTETGVKDTFLVSDSALHKLGNHFIMGLAQHPNYPEDPFFYVTHNYLLADVEGTMGLTCRRYRVDSVTKRLSDPKIFVDGVFVEGSMLPGGRLEIIDDSLLLLATSNENVTEFESIGNKPLSGKILAFDLDGNLIADQNKAMNSIYASGIRNAQGITQSRQGHLFFCDHGPSSDDEVNQLIRHGDYGWPNVWGYCDTPVEERFCAKAGVKEPLKKWTPTIAPGAMAIYEHARYPLFQNALLLGTLKESDLRVLKLNESQDSIVSETVVLDNEIGRIRDIAISDDGRVFLSTANQIPKSFKYNIPVTKEDLEYDVVVELLVKP